MFHILIANFQHETNTFSSIPADFHGFRDREYYEGEDIFRVMTGTRTALGGYLDVLSGQPDVTLHPVVSTACIPCGRVTDEMWSHVKNLLLEKIRSMPQVDGIALGLHGAMATESSDDGEGDLLAVLREAVGPDCPITATLDLHANVTEKMVRNADALCAYRCYPHTDAVDRGREAGTILLRTLRGEIRPKLAFAPIPMLLCAMPTENPAMKKHVTLAAELEKQPGMLSVSIAHGFYCTDVPGDRVAVLAVSDKNAGLAQKNADLLAKKLWDDRESLRRTFHTPESAIRQAEEEKQYPVIFADAADNPGGGSTGDGTHLLRAMLKANVQNSAFAVILDPESAEKCAEAGAGNPVHLHLGGKLCPEILGTPIECDGIVEKVSECSYKNDGPMNAGVPVTTGLTAVVRLGTIRVIVCSIITQPYDVQIFRANGIEPTEQDILVVKSAVHYRAAFEPLMKKVYDIDCPGLMPVTFDSLEYRGLARPVYPLDSI